MPEKKLEVNTEVGMSKEPTEAEIDMMLEREMQRLELHRGRLPDLLRAEVIATAKQYLELKPKEPTE